MAAPSLFISFSGGRSKDFSRWLYRWLKVAMPNTYAYFADEPYPGVNWLGHIQQSMAQAKWIVACITRENVNSGWIYFELGLASAAGGDRNIVVITVGIPPTDLPVPLSLFPAFEFNQERIRSVFEVIARTSDHDSDAVKKFVDDRWPEMEEEAKVFLLALSYPPPLLDLQGFQR